MLIVLCSSFVKLTHTNYYKIVKQLKSFKIIIVAPTCFGLHKPSSALSLCFAKVTMLTSVTNSNNDIYVTAVNIVTLAKHRLRAP